MPTTCNWCRWNPDDAASDEVAEASVAEHMMKKHGFPAGAAQTVASSRAAHPSRE